MKIISRILLTAGMTLLQSASGVAQIAWETNYYSDGPPDLTRDFFRIWNAGLTPVEVTDGVDTILFDVPVNNLGFQSACDNCAGDPAANYPQLDDGWDKILNSQSRTPVEGRAVFSRIDGVTPGMTYRLQFGGSNHTANAGNQFHSLNNMFGAAVSPTYEQSSGTWFSVDITATANFLSVGTHALLGTFPNISWMTIEVLPDPLDLNGDGVVTLDDLCALGPDDPNDLTTRNEILSLLGLSLGDAQGDGVDILDLNLVTDNFGMEADYKGGDFDLSGIVDLGDLQIVNLRLGQGAWPYDPGQFQEAEGITAIINPHTGYLVLAEQLGEKHWQVVDDFPAIQIVCNDCFVQGILEDLDASDGDVLIADDDYLVQIDPGGLGWFSGVFNTESELEDPQILVLDSQTNEPLLVDGIHYYFNDYDGDGDTDQDDLQILLNDYGQENGIVGSSFLNWQTGVGEIIIEVPVPLEYVPEPKPLSLVAMCLVIGLVQVPRAASCSRHTTRLTCSNRCR